VDHVDGDQIEHDQDDVIEDRAYATGHALKAAGGSDTEGRAQQQSEVEPAGVDQQPLATVRVTTQVCAAHPARVGAIRT
jgi:hypothetical protein